MKSSLFRTIAASILIVIPTASASQDFNVGIRAAQAGDFETAVNEWLPLAEQGDVQAQYYLGLLYGDGFGMAQDYQEAMLWYNLAAGQGSPDAQYAIGRLYYNGKGVPQDFGEAAQWYTTAAEQGSGAAQYMLGLLYATGQGVSKDSVVAMKWYRLAAAQGIAPAQNNVGVMHLNGEGTPKDFQTAHMWIQIAGQNGLDAAGGILTDIEKRMTLADIEAAQVRAEVCIASNYQVCDRSSASDEFGAQQEKFDLQRQNDILAISDMVESYFEINGHYPLLDQPQAEVLNVFISDNIPSHFPSGPSYKLLEAELQKSLGTDAVLPRDPEDNGLLYQYATDGTSYYVAAYLYHNKPYAWEQALNVNKVEVSNRPVLRTQTPRPAYLRHVLKFGPDNAEKQVDFSEALKSRNFDRAKKLLESGANPSPTCGFNFRCQPLATAAKNGDLEVMKFLIDNGADIDGFNSYDGVALVFALESQQIEAAKLLINSGANVNIPNAFGFSPFVGAPALGDMELLALMIENGAHINENYYVYVGDPEPGEKGPLPLEVAIRHGQPDAVSFLLDSGADPSLRTSSGEPLSELLRKSDNGATRLLQP